MKYERCIKQVNVHPVVKELTETRLAWDLSTDTVAERIGCSINHFRHLENGSNVPGFRVLNSWADTLGFEVTLRPKK